MTEKMFFIRHGNQTRMTNALPEIRDNLIPGTYAVKTDPGGFYLENLNGFSFDDKIYGDVDRRANRIIETFQQRPNSTGVLLEGEKGSGKTLLAKRVSHLLLNRKISTFIINSPFNGDGFNFLVQAVKEPVMFLFDEFEKVYGQDEQQGLLPLFDGIYPSKKLFLVTVNDSFRVVDQMKNRPGRFFYRMHYSGLDPDFVEEYARDTLLNQEHLKSVLIFASSFQSINFDILKALIEEMNRYNETAAEASKFLNATPFESRSVYVVVELNLLRKNLQNSKLFTPKVSHGTHVNPFKDRVFITLCKNTKRTRKTEEVDYGDNETELDGEEKYIYFSPNDITKLDDGKFFYESKDGIMVIKKPVEEKLDYSKFLG